jgi:hypothetical protein
MIGRERVFLLGLIVLLLGLALTRRVPDRQPDSAPAPTG